MKSSFFIWNIKKTCAPRGSLRSLPHPTHPPPTSAFSYAIHSSYHDKEPQPTSVISVIINRKKNLNESRQIEPIVWRRSIVNLRLSQFFPDICRREEQARFCGTLLFLLCFSTSDHKFGNREGLVAATWSPSGVSAREQRGWQVRQGIFYEPAGLIVESKKSKSKRPSRQIKPDLGLRRFPYNFTIVDLLLPKLFQKTHGFEQNAV